MRVVATDLNNDVAISQKFSDNDIAISVLYRHIAQHESPAHSLKCFYLFTFPIYKSITTNKSSGLHKTLLSERKVQKGPFIHQ